MQARLGKCVIGRRAAESPATVEARAATLAASLGERGTNKKTSFPGTRRPRLATSHTSRAYSSRGVGARASRRARRSGAHPSSIPRRSGRARRRHRYRSRVPGGFLADSARPGKRPHHAERGAASVLVGGGATKLRPRFTPRALMRERGDSTANERRGTARCDVALANPARCSLDGPASRRDTNCAAVPVPAPALTPRFPARLPHRTR